MHPHANPDGSLTGTPPQYITAHRGVGDPALAFDLSHTIEFTETVRMIWDSV